MATKKNKVFMNFYTKNSSAINTAKQEKNATTIKLFSLSDSITAVSSPAAADHMLLVA